MFKDWNMNVLFFYRSRARTHNVRDHFEKKMWTTFGDYSVFLSFVYRHELSIIVATTTVIVIVLSILYIWIASRQVREPTREKSLRRLSSDHDLSSVVSPSAKKAIRREYLRNLNPSIMD